MQKHASLANRYYFAEIIHSIQTYEIYILMTTGGHNSNYWEMSFLDEITRTWNCPVSCSDHSTVAHVFH